MSIFDQIGGPAAVSAAVDGFYLRVLGDPELTAYFDGIDLVRLKSHQRAFIAAALGGPRQYAGRPLGAAHAGLGIVPAHFDRVVRHLADTLADLGVPAATVDGIAATLTPLRDEIAPDPAGDQRSASTSASTSSPSISSSSLMVNGGRNRRMLP